MTLDLGFGTLEEHPNLGLKAERNSDPEPMSTFTLNETPEASYRPTVEQVEEEGLYRGGWCSQPFGDYLPLLSVAPGELCYHLHLMFLAPCPVLSFLPCLCPVHLAFVSQKAAHLSNPKGIIPPSLFDSQRNLFGV